MAGLGFQPERHAGVVLCHHFVKETFGFHRDALSAGSAASVPAAFVGFFGVPS